MYNYRYIYIYIHVYVYTYIDTLYIYTLYLYYTTCQCVYDNMISGFFLDAISPYSCPSSCLWGDSTPIISDTHTQTGYGCLYHVHI